MHNFNIILDKIYLFIFNWSKKSWLLKTNLEVYNRVVIFPPLLAPCLLFEFKTNTEANDVI